VTRVPAASSTSTATSDVVWSALRRRFTLGDRRPYVRKRLSLFVLVFGCRTNGIEHVTFGAAGPAPRSHPLNMLFVEGER